MTGSQTENIPDGALTVPGNDPGNTEAPPFSVGAALREARTRLGLGVAEVSNRIKFAPRQIEALEADDFARLPEAAFVRGFVRSYARLLQLDPAPLLAALPHAPVQSIPLEAKALTEVPFPGVYSERKPNIIWLASALAVAVVLALSAWLFGNRPKVPEAPAAAKVTDEQKTTVETLALPEAVPLLAVLDAAEPGSAVTQPPVAPAAKTAEEIGAAQQAIIRLTFDQDAWVEVTDKHGKTLLSQLNPRGSEQGVNGNPPFNLVIGHAKSVHLYYKGQAIDLAPYIKIEVARLTLE
jgi:cytoskeleton protein RodZ